MLDDALCVAEEAGLTYVSDLKPGITRRRSGKGWSYLDAKGRVVEDTGERGRIASIAIPPAWTEVWISPDPSGHILATGRDAKGRKQYRYHPSWREVRDANKYDRMAAFGTVLPGIRKRIDTDLDRKGLPEDKVLAAVVHLLDETLVRIGNDEYADLNESYGLTTLQDDHAEITGSKVALEFTGKHGIDQGVALRDRRLARIVKQCQDLPGEDLFQYLDEAGQVIDVTSTNVNDYLRKVAKGGFTAKDFRTWGGSVIVAEHLVEAGVPRTKTEAKRTVLAAIDAAAERLGNTRTVARSCYVHPRVTEGYLDGRLGDAWSSTRERRRLSHGESAVLTLLQG